MRRHTTERNGAEPRRCSIIGWVYVTAGCGFLLCATACGPSELTPCDLEGDESLACCKYRARQQRARDNKRCYRDYWGDPDATYDDLQDCLHMSYKNCLNKLARCDRLLGQHGRIADGADQSSTYLLVDVAEPDDALAVPPGTIIELVVRESYPIDVDPVQLLPEEWSPETRSALRESMFRPMLSSSPLRVSFDIYELDDAGFGLGDWVHIGDDEDLADGIPSLTFDTAGLAPGGYVVRALVHDPLAFQQPEHPSTGWGVITIMP